MNNGATITSKNPAIAKTPKVSPSSHKQKNISFPPTSQSQRERITGKRERIVDDHYDQSYIHEKDWRYNCCLASFLKLFTKTQKYPTRYRTTPTTKIPFFSYALIRDKLDMVSDKKPAFQI